MRQMIAICNRELGSFFRLPVGWIIIALFVFITGVVFALSAIEPGKVASMRGFFQLAGWLLLPVTPAISMRLISEEIRSGTIEPLMTSPASDLMVILGKFFAAILFLICMLIPTLALAGVLFAISSPRPDFGPIVAGYLLLILLGSLYLSIGLFISTLTANQTLAFLSTLFSIMLLLMLPAMQVSNMPPQIGLLIESLSIHTRASDFARGLIDSSHITYFISSAFFFLLCAWVSLQSRRWR